ncbi:MAG: hypothetical protein ACOX6T_25890 [Myxococcales bacterium]
MRFRNLERGRAQEPAGDSSAGQSGRFDALEGPAAALAPNATGVAADRFRDPARPAPGPGSGLELAEKRVEDQPFVRCAVCEADNNLHATSCTNCGSSFNTAAQRAFNERLWQQRREEAAREAQALEQLRQQRAAMQTSLAAQRQQAAAELAARVAAQTRARLDAEEREAMLGSGGLPMSTSRRVSALLLANLKAVAIAVGIAVLLVLLAIPRTRGFVFVVALAIVGIYFRFLFWRRR